MFAPRRPEAKPALPTPRFYARYLPAFDNSATTVLSLVPPFAGCAANRKWDALPLIVREDAREEASSIDPFWTV